MDTREKKETPSSGPNPRSPEHEEYLEECGRKGWAYDPTNARATGAPKTRPQAGPDGNRQVQPQ